jgi:hypothetical protein
MQRAGINHAAIEKRSRRVVQIVEESEKAARVSGPLSGNYPGVGSRIYVCGWQSGSRSI